MKYFSIFLLFCLVLISACNTETIEEKAARIHAEVLTIDTHTDTPLFFINRDFNIGDNGDARKDGSKYDLNRMVRGGLDAAFFAVFIGQGPRDEESLFKVREKTDRIFKAVHKQVDQYPDNAEIASRSLGMREQELHKQSENKNTSWGKGGNKSTGRSKSVDLKESRCVLAGEIQGLPRASDAGGPVGFLKLSGVSKVTKLKWPFDSEMEKTVEATILADWVSEKELPVVVEDVDQGEDKKMKQIQEIEV